VRNDASTPFFLGAEVYSEASRTPELKKASKAKILWIRQRFKRIVEMRSFTVFLGEIHEFGD
jgi:hypothetical protein